MYEEKLDAAGAGTNCDTKLSRSATIVIAYLMQEKNMNFDEAF